VTRPAVAKGEGVLVEMFRVRRVQELIAEIERDVIGHLVAGARHQRIGEIVAAVVHAVIMREGRSGDVVFQARMEQADADADIGREAGHRGDVVIAADQPAPGRVGTVGGVAEPGIVGRVLAEIADRQVGAEIVVEMIADADATPEAAVLDAGMVEVVMRLAGIVGDVAAQIPARADLDGHVLRGFLDIDRGIVVGGEGLAGRNRREGGADGGCAEDMGHGYALRGTRLDAASFIAAHC
jgi:hypothetical protein